MSLPGGRRFGLRLPGVGRVGFTQIVLGALVVVVLGVESIGALPMRVELFTRGGRGLAMGARGALKPGGFRGLGFGLGLRGPGLRLGFGRDGLALLDACVFCPTS